MGRYGAFFRIPSTIVEPTTLHNIVSLLRDVEKQSKNENTGSSDARYKVLIYQCLCWMKSCNRGHGCMLIPTVSNYCKRNYWLSRGITLNCLGTLINVCNCHL